MKLIVTAGGQGTKLWPYSRESFPKQFQNIISDQSLFCDTINTLQKRFNPRDIIISTKNKYAGIVSRQAPNIPKENYFLEPDFAKNRGPGEGFAFVMMTVKYPTEPFMLIQPDCIRQPEESFLDMIGEAEKLVVSDKKMVTGGIKAAYPIMGIDYIKLGEKLDISSNLQIYRVDSFIPRADDFEKTKELIKDSRVATHSNHVCWYAELALEAYKNHRQDWHQALMKIRDIIVSGGPQSAIDEIYSTMASGATEEVTQHILTDAYIILLPFRWTDIGTWNSLYEFFSKNGEVYQDGKNIVALNSKESIVKCANNKKIIAAYGLEDLVVIDTNDALLIIPKSKADKVGDLLKEVKERGMANFL